MTAAPTSRDLTYWVVFGLLVALLAAVHFGGAIEFWSLAAFYRGKLRSAFATYRVELPHQTASPGRSRPSHMSTTTCRQRASTSNRRCPVSKCDTRARTGRPPVRR